MIIADRGNVVSGFGVLRMGVALLYATASKGDVHG